MGGSAWSDSHYADRAKVRLTANKPVFEYDADIKAGKVTAAAHASLNPMGLKVRESRDSDAHPESRAISLWLDQTGSMGEVPKILQKNLPKLMGLLIRQGYVAHPQIQIGAIGDWTNHEKAPLQVGQFESGIEIENDLANLYLESCGGGTREESYELGLYVLARHTAIDCLEKRDERGYAFIIGDEKPYPKVSRQAVADLIGINLQSDIPTEDIVREAMAKYHVYFVLPKMTNHWDDPVVWKRWTALLGQNCLRLEEPAGICELIATTIGLNEGIIEHDAVDDGLVKAGSDRAIAKSVSKALATAGKSGAGKGGAGTAVALPETGAPSGLATF